MGFPNKIHLQSETFASSKDHYHNPLLCFESDGKDLDFDNSAKITSFITDEGIRCHVAPFCI